MSIWSNRPKCSRCDGQAGYIVNGRFLCARCAGAPGPFKPPELPRRLVDEVDAILRCAERATYRKAPSLWAQTRRRPPRPPASAVQLTEKDKELLRKMHIQPW